MIKEIALAISGTLLLVSITLNVYQLKGYAFLPPATYDEQLAEAHRLIAQDAIAPEENDNHRKAR